MKRSAASEEKLLQAPRAMQMPPHTNMLADSHLATDSFCMAKLVGYSALIHLSESFCGNSGEPYDHVAKVEDGTQPAVLGAMQLEVL